MADAHQTHDHDAPHEGPIKTPKQLIWAVFFAFVIPIIGIILLANFVSTGVRPAAGSDGLKEAATALRISPVAGVPDIKDMSDLSTLKSGDVVYAAQCASCHASGQLGSPKFGDTAAWAPRLPQGAEKLIHSAVAGKNAMPAQGGNVGDFSDFEIARAVVYMANKAGGKLAEPALPAASGAAAAASDPVAGAASGAAPAAASAPAAAAAPAAASAAK